MNVLDTLGRMLGGKSEGFGGPLAKAAMDLLQDNANGGMGGLLDQLAKAGLGEQVASWVSTGKNIPVSGEDFTHALGEGRVQDLARRAGVSPEAAGGQLARILPQLVDQLTPDGRIPGGDVLARALESLQGRRG